MTGIQPSKQYIDGREGVWLRFCNRFSFPAMSYDSIFILIWRFCEDNNDFKRRNIEKTKKR